MLIRSPLTIADTLLLLKADINNAQIIHSSTKLFMEKAQEVKWQCFILFCLSEVIVNKQLIIMFDNGNYDTFIDYCVKLNSNNIMTIPRSYKNVLLLITILDHFTKTLMNFFGLSNNLKPCPIYFVLLKPGLTADAGWD